MVSIFSIGIVSAFELCPRKEHLFILYYLLLKLLWAQLYNGESGLIFSLLNKESQYTYLKRIKNNLLSSALPHCFMKSRTANYTAFVFYINSSGIPAPHLGQIGPIIVSPQIGQTLLCLSTLSISSVSL